MKREIKFRAWVGGEMAYSGKRIGTDYHCWTEGMLVDKCLLGKENELMQYTGLHDKNGKEIWEGDIVRVLYTDWASQSDYSISLEEYKKSISMIGEIIYEGVEFRVDLANKKYGGTSTASMYVGQHGEIEVIGNIYENPELINN